MSFKENIGAGGIAGLTAVLCTHPLDLLQVRLQSSRELKNVEIIRNSRVMTKGIQGLRGIVHLEGWSGLFRGLLPSLASYVPSKAIFFGFYGFTRKQIIKRGLFDEKSYMTALIPASVGIMATSMLLNPLFLMKTRIQVQEDFRKGKMNNIKNVTSYRGYVDCAKQIYRKEGILAFYRGISASWLGISETALYFMFYEKMKQVLGVTKKLQTKESFPVHLIVGTTILCKLAAHTIAYPHEVIRTRMREKICAERVKMIDLIKNIYQKEGMIGFYGGMGIHLIRVIPNSIIVFLVYEFVKSRFFN